MTDNTAQVSNIFDTLGAGSAALAIITGTDADADATFAVLMEESDASDMTGANAVADDDLIGTEALAGWDFNGDNVCRKVGYIGYKRYIRATVTPTGNTGNLFLSGMWVRSRVNSLPTANPPA